MCLKDLLDSVTFEDVAPQIVWMYPVGENSLKWYKIHFDMLRLLKPQYSNDTNSNSCKIFWAEWKNREFHLTADAINDVSWEFALTKELIIDPEVKATNAEIVACCLWHTSYYGFVKELDIEHYELDEIKMGFEDWWDGTNDYNKVKAKKYFSVIQNKGGYIPNRKELTLSQKSKLISHFKRKFGVLSRGRNKHKRKRLFRRGFASFYYVYLTKICKFIIRAIPALSDERNSMRIEQLCGLFLSELFVAKIMTSYADENTNGAKYFCELLEMEDIHTRLDRMVVVLTTGEWHQELTEDEQHLCKLLIGNCKSFDILVVTDPKLGRQVRIDYATFNSKYPLVK